MFEYILYNEQINNLKYVKMEKNSADIHISLLHLLHLCFTPTRKRNHIYAPSIFVKGQATYSVASLYLLS